MGQLINAPSVDRFQEALREVEGEGGEIVSGGGVLPGPGNFVEPTLVRAKPQWPIVQRETFGPILYVMPYQNRGEAIDMHNSPGRPASSL